MCFVKEKPVDLVLSAEPLCLVVTAGCTLEVDIFVTSRPTQEQYF